MGHLHARRHHTRYQNLNMTNARVTISRSDVAELAHTCDLEVTSAVEGGWKVQQTGTTVFGPAPLKAIHAFLTGYKMAWLADA